MIECQPELGSILGLVLFGYKSVHTPFDSGMNVAARRGLTSHGSLRTAGSAAKARIHCRAGGPRSLRCASARGRRRRVELQLLGLATLAQLPSRSRTSIDVAAGSRCPESGISNTLLAGLVRRINEY